MNPLFSRLRQSKGSRSIVLVLIGLTFSLSLWSISGANTLSYALWGKKKNETPSVGNPNSSDTKTPEEEARLHYNRGVELFQIGQIQAEKGNLSGQRDLLKQSIKNFESALSNNNDMVEAQSNIGFAYLTMKEYKKAIREFKKALQLNSKHLNTLNGLATCLALNKDIDSAIQTFDQLTSLDPGNPQFYFNKGSVLQKVGRFEEARTAYEEALRIDPKEQRSLFNLGTLYENQGEPLQAKAYYQQAKKINISNPIGLEAVRRLEALDIISSASNNSTKQ